MPPRLISESVANLKSVQPNDSNLNRGRTGRAIGKWAGTPWKFEPTDEQRKLVFRLKVHGLNLKQISQFIENRNGTPIDDDTLKKYFWYELEMGLAETNMAVSQKALQHALGSPAEFDEEGNCIRKEITSNPFMVQWWEKTRAGMKEAGKTDLSIPQGGRAILVIEG